MTTSSTEIRCLVTILVLLVAGCVSQPVNQKNAVLTELTPSYQASIAKSVGSAQFEPWWQNFNRPTLSSLVEQALSRNFTLVEAVARLNESRAIATETKSALFPQLRFEAEATKSWQGSDSQSSLGSLGGVLSWEIDLFNRLGSAVTADQYRTQALAQDLQVLRLSLSAQVANTYFAAIAAKTRLKLLNQQVKTDQELLDLLILRFESGIGTNVDVLQQKSRVQDSFSFIPIAESDYEVFENRLDVLLGVAPDGKNRVNDDETLNFAINLPAVGVPADLLLQRPDLRAAQAELIAADADIANAIADRLPNITLGASVASARTTTFSGPVSMLMASFVQPLLDWGQRKAVVAQNKAIYQQKLAAFTDRYLKAVEEVENALTKEEKQREFLNRLKTRQSLLEETLAETEALYTQGVNDYLPVLNALQQLRVLERNLVNEQLELINTRIMLYRAIGGNLALSDTVLNKNNQGE